MALTVGEIKAQEVLKALTPEQLTVIANLSVSNETAIIGAKMGEVLGGIDGVIKELLGKDKPHGMKTTDFVKAELASLKAAGNTTELTAQLATLKQEKTALEKQITEGNGDEALKGQVAQLTQQLADKDTSITQLQSNLDKAKETYGSELQGLKWGGEFGTALTGLNFKSEEIISKSLRDSHLNTVRAKIKEEYVMDTVNNQTVYRDKNGTLVTSPTDAARAATLTEILTPRVTDLIDAGHKSTGTGTTGATGATGSTGGILISGAKTKVEATAMIEKELATKGVARNSKDYQTQLQQAYAENKVSELPLI